jgi:acetolactate synthase-1/2/3 large subunit
MSAPRTTASPATATTAAATTAIAAPMTGAEALLRTLTGSGVDTCFANPGTSEMHFVAALDRVPGMRAVLALFEGVATGAADGYGRMARKPAATLLHLGPGLGNGIANLHNARRARTPLVNVVGDHATYHKALDAPLESDIESLARPVSGWYRWSSSTATLGADAAEAVAAAMGPPGRVATLVVPADVSWLPGAEVGRRVEPAGPAPADPEAVGEAAKALRSGEPAALLLGGRALGRRCLEEAGRIAAAAGAKLLAETFPARLERGAGIPAPERLGYLAEMQIAQMEGLRHLVVVVAPAPVSFFAYPGKPSKLVPEGCNLHVLATGADDVEAALQALGTELGSRPGAGPPDVARLLPDEARPAPPAGALDAAAVGQALGALLPEDAIVVDEGNTAGLFAPGATAGAPPHDWLCLTGGAIGQGMPLATGAAVACPGRPVLCLEADGSAMYTPQALWTQAREGLDVTTVVLDNRAYAILSFELSRVGAEPPGPTARRLLDIGSPDLDFVAIGGGMGVPSTRATSAPELVEALRRAFAEPGPHLIDAILTS